MAAPARAAARGRADPQSDPRFKRVIDKLGADSRTLKRHPPAAKKANEPAAAAQGPANEKAGGARIKQVDKLEGAETPKPQTASFLEILQAEIAKAMPKTLGDTEKFMKGGSSNELKSSLKGNVAEQKQEATGDLKKTSNEAPSEAGVPAKPVTPIAAEPHSATPDVKGAEAMPAPKSDAEVSLQASKQDVQADLDKEKLTDTRLQKANDSRFSAVLGARDAAAKQADAGPGQYRAKETATLAQAATKAADVAKKGAVALLGVKTGSKAKVLSRQQQQKLKEEQELKSFTDFVVATFERAKQSVDRRLEQLETKVNELFDRGVEAALSAMKSYVEDELHSYKLKRYLLRPFGFALWLKDQILDLPEEVNRFYEAGRVRFTTSMNALAVQVANLVESQLAAAKHEVKTAQAQIAAKAATLSPGVKTRAAQVQAEFAGKFAELESGIENKKQQLAEGLAQKYKEAFDKADEALKAIQEENKGLVSKVKEKIGAVIKALLEFKERLMAILRKGSGTLDQILEDPGQFLSNLIAAIKLGFQQFVANIWGHLRRGFAKWLFGALAGAGIEIPSDLTLPSILKLVLGVLGITYERMRAKAVKLLGPTAVAIIEKVVEYVRALISGGPAALWEKVKEDLSNLKEMVIDAIQDWLITTIVKQAVAKVVSMFNPVGAIIQIILMIINIVRFVVERAAQIMDFVEAVVSSIATIASGAIGGAANWIERSLGNMVPILIGFLASLLGLGGISQKIKEFITKVQAKVDAAIDKAIAKVVALVKKLFGALKAGAKALLQWWKKKLAFSGGDESHTLLFKGEKDSAELVVHSDEKKPEDFVLDFASTETAKPAQAKVRALSKEIDVLKKKVASAQKKDPPDEAAIAKGDADLTAKFNELGAVLADVLKNSAGEGGPTDPLPIEYPKRRAAAYPNIYVGPRSEKWIPQDVLKAAAAAGGPSQARQVLRKQIPANERDDAAITAWNGDVKVLRAAGGVDQSLPNGTTVGLDPAFANVAPGKVLAYEDKGSTGGGSKINNAFKPFGFRPGKEGLDGDHVMERQLGGPDSPANLWPLKAGENRSSGSTVKNITVKFRGKPTNVHAARVKLKKILHLLIKKTIG